MKDVAALAGVSPKTVSNVINGFVHVTPATRDRVKDAIRHLGYRPNTSARNLRRGRTGMVGLIVPELDIPYFAELARCFLEAAAGRFTILIEQTLGEREREEAVLAALGGKVVDGIVLSPLTLRGTELMDRLAGTPVVLIGERPSGGLADHVAVDNIRAARDAVQHLIGLGRGRIAAVGVRSEPFVGTPLLRLTGYREALHAAGLPGDRGLECETPGYHRRHGADAMTALLDRGERPDAVFCFNDALALGVLRVLHERGLRVPEDIAVIGFDDVDEGRFSVPSLSSVSPDKTAVAERALALLQERIETPSAPVREIVIGHRLRVRESTGVREGTGTGGGTP
ncbi:LacI family DNA-binding transcriptional regulator [Streptomyces tsukubensis]|uniref:LacI family transcriptional regulator n=1 Tax=Streptomyces tsukubensis TaxID=83656 RepID=A0A1V4AFU3_9ACTN|nr:LacI family DNA-binding transcriptional regulator [Streptomyces tsukubensis]OON82896.1 LacI family transcriptional regulator [Streptomyces tsukubensis]QFR91920.1 LacI family DNA-binding transcriptional regulator [Streptomyces tsukubensis]